VKKLACLFVLSFFALTNTKVSTVTIEQLQQKTLKNNDTLYVVNFWATWCKPCVQELPYFQETAKKYAGKKVKIIFVSLNSAKESELVGKFADDKKIKEEMLLLNAGNPNVWIDQLEKKWSGSIPATFLYKNKSKLFFKEGELKQTELDSIIKTNK
jgi:thiol-disulfide isomerase/thioredoxin